MKVGLLIRPNENAAEAEASTSSRRKRFKSGSVKKLLLLFIVQAVPETYGNMHKIMLELGIGNLTVTISCDLKVHFKLNEYCLRILRLKSFFLATQHLVRTSVS